jgi:hypothetical protein
MLCNCACFEAPHPQRHPKHALYKKIWHVFIGELTITRHMFVGESTNIRATWPWSAAMGDTPYVRL